MGLGEQTSITPQSKTVDQTEPFLHRRKKSRTSSLGQANKKADVPEHLAGIPARRLTH
jgi:hypothetical protein